MRLILTTIILMLLMQPVLAESVGSLYLNCKSWQNSGYKNPSAMSGEGINSLRCYEYMNAMTDVGAQNCIQPEGLDAFKWYATPMQLAQHFINTAEAKPELWQSNPYLLITTGIAHKVFPCKE